MKEQYEKFVGKSASVVLHGLRVPVKIIDYKESYGKSRWQVTPIGGEGFSWVEQEPQLD